MAETQVKRLSSRHEDIMNFIIANPLKTYGEVAGKFGVTPAWLSVIVNSDVFRKLLAERREQVFDAAVLQGIDTKLEAAVDLGLDKYLEQIPTMNADQVINGTDKLLGRLGFGTRVNGATIQANNVQINNNVSPEVLAEARARIGQVKTEKAFDQIEVGEADPQPALSGSSSETRSEEKGLDIREEGA